MAAQFVTFYDVDLMKPAFPQPLRQMVGEGDAYGLAVGAVVTRDGSPVSLGGNCIGKVLRADGGWVPLTGVIDGNKAYVVLDASSCEVEGPIQVAVCWEDTNNNRLTTLLIACGTVVKTESGTAIQPSDPIPNVDQLVAEIETMRTATAAANAAAEGALDNFAPPFVEATANAAGSYVMYTDGKLYYLPNGHTANATWANTTKTAVTVGGELVGKEGEIGELKSATMQFQLTNSTAIPSNSDLNDFITAGDYYISNNTIAGTITNIPKNTAGRLLVIYTINSTRLAQIYITNYNPVGIYVRQYNGSWQTWRKLADDADISDLGNHVFNLNSSNTEITTGDVNEYLTPGNYYVGSVSDAGNITHLPETIAGRLTVISNTTSQRVIQIYVTNDSVPKIYTRYYNSTKWFAWSRLASADDVNDLSTAVKPAQALITSSNYTDYFTDYNDIPVNSVYNIADNVPLLNSPPGTTVLNDVGVTSGYIGGTVVTFCGNSTQVRQRMQIFTSRSTLIPQSVVCVRTGATSNGVIVWSPWQKFSNFLNLSASNVVIRAATASEHFTDLDDAPINSIYQIDLDCADGVLAHHPNPGKSNVLVTLGFSYTSRHGMIQICVGLAPGTTAAMWFRYGFINQPDEYIWTPWAKVITE